jgi:hypothetical protein
MKILIAEFMTDHRRARVSVDSCGYDVRVTDSSSRPMAEVGRQYAFTHLAGKLPLKAPTSDL